MTIVIIIFGIIFLIFSLYLMYKYDIKHNVYIIVNDDNIQKKKYKIRRKDIIKTRFENKKTYVIITKRYIYKLIYLKEIKLFTSGHSFFEFESDMEKIFEKKFFNGFRMNSDAPVKFEIIENKEEDLEEKVSEIGHWK